MCQWVIPKYVRPGNHCSLYIKYEKFMIGDKTMHFCSPLSFKMYAVGMVFPLTSGWKLRQKLGNNSTIFSSYSGITLNHNCHLVLTIKNDLFQIVIKAQSLIVKSSSFLSEDQGGGGACGLFLFLACPFPAFASCSSDPANGQGKGKMKQVGYFHLNIKVQSQPYAPRAICCCKLTPHWCSVKSKYTPC